MQYIVKDLEAKTEQTLDVADIMLGAKQGDNKTLLFLVDGTKKELYPADRYLISAVPKEEPPSEAPPLTLDERKALKLAELSAACENTIYKGCDVILSDGTKGHISLTLQDQYNISEAKSAIEKGATGAPYHLDGGIPCHFYPAADIVILYVESKRFVLYNTTYCNHLNAWVRRCQSIEEVQAITYGSKLPEDLASNLQAVLEKSYKELQHVA